MPRRCIGRMCARRPRVDFLVVLNRMNAQELAQPIWRDYGALGSLIERRTSRPRSSTGPSRRHRLLVGFGLSARVVQKCARVFSSLVFPGKQACPRQLRRRIIRRRETLCVFITAGPPVLKYRVPHGSQCVMGRLIHTGLGSSSLIAHVLHSPPPPTRTAL
jgi:hypothetical protein